MRFFRCGCGCEGIAVEKDVDTYLAKTKREFKKYTYYFGMWSYGVDKNSYTFREQLRHIWYILKNGHPYTDEVVFDEKTFNKFVTYLNKLKDEK